MSQKCKQCDLRKLGSQPVAESHVLGRSSCASRLPQVLDEWPKHHRLHVGYVPAGAGYLAKCGHHEDHLLHLVLLHWQRKNLTAKVQGASSKTCRTRGCQSRWSECRIVPCRVMTLQTEGSCKSTRISKMKVPVAPAQHDVDHEA